eukprot:403345430
MESQSSSLPQIKLKIAQIEDKSHILHLMNDNANLIGGYDREKFEIAGSYVLQDIDNGFFILAYEDRSEILNNQEEQSSSSDPNSNIIPAGFMFFTYEWSDWRNGLFFWMQSCHVTQDYRKAGVFNKMCEFLQQYMKDQGCCGLRLNAEVRLDEMWAPIVKKLGMKQTHYYIYDIDASTN